MEVHPNDKSDGNYKPTSSSSPNTFSMITWNLDGLDIQHLQRRTDAVVDLIQNANHSIIFFQELIPTTYEYFVFRLKSKYHAVAGTTNTNSEYFTATFLRLNDVVYIDHEIVTFPGTRMGRTVLITKCHVGHIKLVLLNTHLESTAAYARERVTQFKICFERCISFEPDWNVIFGGDLNMRDSEVSGKIPANMCDLWIKCGSIPVYKHTWDLIRNKNKQMPSPKQPQCRFDRVYYRESIPATITPDCFELAGLDKVIGIDYFPSDHFAIVAVFRSVT